MIIQNMGSENKADISFTVTHEDYIDAKDILEETIESIRKDPNDNGFADAIVVADDSIAKVTIVGRGMRSQSGVATRMFRTLAEKNINIQMISTSEIKISVVIDANYAELAVRALHEEFLENQEPRLE